MVRSYFSKRMTRRWPLVLFYNMIDVSAINAFIIWQGMSHENGNLFIRGKKKVFDKSGKELCQHTKEAVPPTLSTRKRNISVAENGASLSKRARCTFCDRKKDRKCQSLCFRCGGVPLSVFLKDITSKLAGFFFTISVYLLSAKQRSCEYHIL